MPLLIWLNMWADSDLSTDVADMARAADWVALTNLELKMCPNSAHFDDCNPGSESAFATRSVICKKISFYLHAARFLLIDVTATTLKEPSSKGPRFKEIPSVIIPWVTRPVK